ncbi:hypothetical protein V6N12_067535 [Hibiscus sabdariffa]|uniref:Uncharacterized protein n=1 Tax=Hibiscus sabdariffa TaxID=183260 RepID=A0ABR2B860_9ROSI
MINNNKRAFEFYRREKQKLNETQSQKSEDQWLLRERTNNQRLYSIFLSAVSARELEIRDQPRRERGSVEAGVHSGMAIMGQCFIAVCCCILYWKTSGVGNADLERDRHKHCGWRRPLLGSANVFPFNNLLDRVVKLFGI